MLAAIPTPEPSGAQANTVAECGEATAAATEVQERAVQHLDPTEANGAWLL
jgi:hypothetical protein